ncbi:MAG TPA: hypothetical protein VH020_07790 [Stellaceae bacterium]|jgi:hypothetical protein|nr:hypothetical protein [Stellaceae bacterium]
MNRDLLLENPRTGAVRPFRDGFDWILFLFSGVLGIPLFINRLPQWGALFVGLWIVGVALHWLLPRNWMLGGQLVLAVIFFGLQLWLGFYGRELILKAYVARGWRRRERAPKPRQGRKRQP